MAFHVHVQLQGSSDPVESPPMDRSEAETHLGIIRGVLGTPDVPDLPWIAVTGENVLAAHIYETFDAGDVNR